MQLFAAMDRDRSGRLELAEIRGALQRMDVAPHFIRALPELLDLDGDEAIDIQEFVSFVEANKSGAPIDRAAKRGRAQGPHAAEREEQSRKLREDIEARRQAAVSHPPRRRPHAPLSRSAAGTAHNAPAGLSAHAELPPPCVRLGPRAARWKPRA